MFINSMSVFFELILLAGLAILDLNSCCIFAFDFCGARSCIDKKFVLRASLTDCCHSMTRSCSSGMNPNRRHHSSQLQLAWQLQQHLGHPPCQFAHKTTCMLLSNFLSKLSRFGDSAVYEHWLTRDTGWNPMDTLSIAPPMATLQALLE